MCQAVLHLLILTIFSCHSLAENVTNVTCLEHQKAFGDSCFEFVGISRSFQGAEAWCEENGGHLAFIPDKDTQYFLQRYMDTMEDMWFGVAPSVKGDLSWLDGSPVTYSNWVSSPKSGAACGHILRNSGFQWEATTNCSKKLNFICQFESGRTIVCEGRNTTLQCGSGQVLMIDGGFYGRKSIHYCRSRFSPPASSQHECRWVNAAESITAHCHGRQICQIADVVNTFEELCPQLRSYLSVDYHCEAGLTLSMNTTAAVLDDVRIEVKWLVHSPQENLSCRLNTGDDHIIHLKITKGLESIVVHKYTYPSTYTVAVECTSSETHIAAQKIITIQERVAEIGVIRCYAGKLSFYESNCKALYGEALQIQVEVKTGTNVAYRIESGKKLLSGLSVVRGIEPQNITVTPKMVEQLGSGCHHLILHASNMVTFPEVSKDLQVCILEKIVGLQASVLTVSNDCLHSPFITFGVSLERGEPVLLLFSVIGKNDSFSETGQMNKRKGIFRIGHPIQGSVQVKLRAWNVFSSLEVDMSVSCGRESVSELNGQNAILLGFKKRWREKHVRVVRNSGKIQAEPTNSVTKRVDITLSYTGNQNGKKDIEWGCADSCKCEGPVKTEDHIINQSCLPDPFVFYKYYVKIINNGGHVDDTEYICITLTPHSVLNISLTCFQGCDPVQANTDIKIKMECSGSCPQVVWHIEDPRSERFWPSATKQCYKDAGRRPLVDKQDGGTEYTVTPNMLRSHRDVTVVVTTSDDTPLYKKLTIQTSSLSTQNSTSQNTDTVESLKAATEEEVDYLTTHGLLSGETIGSLFGSVSDALNAQTNHSEKEDRQKLREKMLDIMIQTVNEDPTKTPKEVQLIARGLVPLVQKGDELSLSAQELAASFFANLSSSLLDTTGNKSEEIAKLMLTTATIIVEGISNIFSYSSNKNISDALLDALNSLQSVLLFFKEPDEEPSIIQKGHITVFVRRQSQKNLHREPINTPNCSWPAFSLPKLPSTIFPSKEAVDIRMLGLDKNPFSWSEARGISDYVSSLSLTTQDGFVIPVEKITQDIEVLLPRSAGEQVNTTVLDLGNFSTTIIDIPSADTTLVLKMMPSKDPLPFKLLLGYNEYPTEKNYVAATEMPQQGNTQEEKYTWLLYPKDLKGNTGVHYLVVRPIVGPGIKSINATLSITPITTSCKFWDELLLDWSNYGCRVGINTTSSETQCLCNHLTFFGSSFFVTPNLVDPSRTAELFATFADNPVVVCFVGALFVTYLLAVVLARRKDIKDTAKVKVTVLEDNDPMDEYRYLLSVCTGYRIGASTSAQVTVTLLGAEGNSEPHHLTDPKKPVFERGAVDMFLLTTPFSLGDLQGIRLWHNNSGSHPAWYVGNVMVQDLQTEQKWHFLCNSWLSVDIDDCSLDKVFPVSTEMELKKFSNLFFMKTTKDFNDGHLWYSVISRPPSSNFTCVQRVSCCFSLLLCTMLTSIMFYGIPKDPSEQTMDLGHFEFTWQQFMIGVQSSLIMFPVNILIVSIFRNTRPRETACCQRKNKKLKTQKQMSISQTVSSQTASTSTNASASLDFIIKDITRIAHSLSKTAKSNIPCKQSEFGPGQQNDINAILSVMEDFIKQNNKTGENTQTKTKSHLSEGGIQKKSNKTQYLHRQLCHINEELSKLGPSSFSNPHSYYQALQQIQNMKGLLEDQLLTSSSVDPNELTNKTSSQSDSTDGDSGQKKRMCCHGGLPWWFIFVGWLLVVATSFISAYFTMLYGLKFGKERSISWLVSMIVSFFQSTLLIQPLKVLCLAIFVALIIKKVDEEDFQNVQFERNDTHIGDQQIIRRHGDFYEPPPPANIERMRRKKIMEQKAFALLREILIYMGFLWMLLVVAYGQRDPNAFYLNTHIRKSFCGAIMDSMSDADVFSWANTSLLGNLFGVYPGFITDGNSKLVGNARLRQLRVQKNSCEVARPMLALVPHCYAPYSWDMEDMGSYRPGWKQSVGNNISTRTSSPWNYQTQAQLRAYPVWGKMVLYRGGGFAVDLGPDLQNASSTLEYLYKNRWLDMYTRVIFVEFTVYNANVNLFCIVTLLLENIAAGTFQLHSEVQSVRLYQSTGGLYTFVMTAEIIYLLFIIYYMFVQAKLMKQQHWLYFKNKWNLLELTIIILSWSAVAVFIKRTLLGNREITYYQHHKDQFASFYEIATADSLLQYLIAFLVLLTTIKLWHLLRLNPKMNMITAALQRAWTDISGFLLIVVIMLLAYSIVSNVMYGWKISSYKTLLDALLAIIGLQIGIFNYDEVLDDNFLLGGLLIGSCIVFMTFVVLNLLLSVILVAFKQEQIHHKPSEEEEIVDLMLRKIYSLFGIKYKLKKDTLEPDVNGSSDSALNNSRNIPNTSSLDVNIFQTSDKSVDP